MAQNLVLNILAKDKTKQALNGVRAGLTNLRRCSIFSSISNFRNWWWTSNKINFKCWFYC
jgi:hypothetical protein